MFKTITDIIKNVDETVETTLKIVKGIGEGEMPSKKDIEILLEAGISIYSISEMTGIGVDILQEIVDKKC